MDFKAITFDTNSVDIVELLTFIVPIVPFKTLMFDAELLILYKFPDDTKFTLKVEILELVTKLLLTEKFVTLRFKLFDNPLTFKFPVLKLTELSVDKTVILLMFKLEDVIPVEIIFTELVCKL